MCGIFVCLKCDLEIELLRYYFNLLKHRGPNNSTFARLDDDVIFGFHRLAIMDTSDQGNQPFQHNGIHLVCNGEIFNHKVLEEIAIKTKYIPETQTFVSDNTYTFKSKSDCECILYLYAKYGIQRTVKELDAEFAFVIYDQPKRKVYAARDRFGVRPLFIGFTNDDDGGGSGGGSGGGGGGGSKQLYFASEAKALLHCHNVMPFPPGNYLELDLDKTLPTPDNILCWHMKRYYWMPSVISYFNKEYASERIRNLFVTAVKKRTMSDQAVGCLLSGGLDSSLVAAVLVKLLPNVKFFSIGLSESVDVSAAKRVIEFLKVPKENHHICEFTIEEGWNALPHVIYHLETYDTTTIRAGTPQYLLAKYISQNTNVKVIFSGEGSDELNAGYAYSKMAPSAQELREDAKRLLSELYMFDNKRTDRTTAAFGLEVRVPFLDNDLVDFVLATDPEFQMCQNVIEKKLFRDAFQGWLPDEILYRPKEAFSDAVSSKDISWYRSLQKLIDRKITDDNLANQPYTFNPPKTREALHYRNIFNHQFGRGRDKLISHYWLPKWQAGEINDPSATVLPCYGGGMTGAAPS